MARVEIGEGISIDVERLIETRLVVQANSGGGKSWLIRKILEETHGKVQQIVLDPEGEFKSLREKYDFVVAGKGGDVSADPRTAELLALKVLDLEVSLIVDLYELKQHERVRFVKNFLEAMVNADRKLWHPVLVVIDEANIFAPEKSRESESLGAVVDLATRGRKRGFASIIATQRLSALNKDVAAECLNKLIGRTSLDIDRKRAGQELGFSSEKDNLALRSLKPGEFYAFGPAISDEVVRGKVGKVKTTHIAAGERIGFKNTKPTEKIKGMLSKLADLPQEAEKEVKDKEGMQKKIRDLEKEVIELRRQSEKRKPSEEELAQAERRGKIGAIKLAIKRLQEMGESPGSITVENFKEKYIEPVKPTLSKDAKVIVMGTPKRSEEDGVSLGVCEKKILGFLNIRRGEFFSKIQVGAMTGYSHTSGSFNNAVSKLNTAGFIERNNAGDLALKHGPNVNGMVDGVQHRLEDWIQKLSKCEKGIYEYVLSARGVSFAKEEIGNATGYSAGSGSFNNAISRLNTLGLIKKDGDGKIRLNPEIENFQ